MAFQKNKLKFISCASLSFLIAGSLCVPVNALRINKYDNENIDIDSVVVIDQETGDVLYGQKEDKVRNIASVTKCMTVLLTLEAVDRGDLSLDSIVDIEQVPDTWGSCFGFKKGEKYTIYELLEMAMIISANDACIVLANAVSGSEEAFVKSMNDKARRLGMTNTKFFNTNGLPLDRSANADGGNLSTAKDIAYLVKFISDNYFDVINGITSMRSLQLGDMEGARGNTNKLLYRNDSFNGFVVDGFKTGFTNQAGFCLATTSEHDNGTPDDNSDDFRVIGVSLGGVAGEHRFVEHSKMLQSISDRYVRKTLASTKDVIHTINEFEGTSHKIDLVPQSDLSILAYNGDISSYEKEVHITDNIAYPVKKGDVLGRVIFRNKDNASMSYSVNLISANDVSKVTLFDKIFNKNK